jgi:hypothetical protein
VLLLNDNLPDMRQLESARQCCDGEAASCGMCSGSDVHLQTCAQNLRAVSGCTCGCGRKEAGVACEEVICDGKRAHVPEAHWTFEPACKCERRAK